MSDLKDDPDKSDNDNDLDDKWSNVVFSKRLLKRFILLYKELPCLWDRRCQWYKTKMKRHEAITKLTDLVREHDPTATRVHVLRKIESIRACVRRERKKVKDSYMIASSSQEVYTPHLWYYDLMSFVFEDEPTSFHYTDPQQSFEAKLEYEGCDDDTDCPATEDLDQTERYPDYSLATSMVVADSSKHSDDCDIGNTSNNSRGTKRHCTEVDDEYDAIGVNVAAKLRGLPPNMRILSEKLINDVLFQAQVNGLSSATTISTPDPFK